MTPEPLATNIISFPTIDYFGGCPKCGLHDGYLNVWSAHWFYCERHRTKWCVGSNLFSSWQEQDEASFQHNAHKLASYGVVKPLEAAHA